MSVLDLRYPRLLATTVGYEFRKQTQFRVGFIVREMLNGVIEPLVMLFLFTALYASAGAVSGEGEPVVLGGWSYEEILKYVAGLMIVRKIVFHNRALNVSNEIFEGRITKYLVMPFRFFILIQGRFVQFTLMQVGVAGIVWSIGYAVMGDRWLVPVSGTAVLQASVLLLMGSYCCFLLYFLLHSLAFWLDVVWSLIVMAWFIISFVGGAVIPVSQMPEPMFRVLSLAFPYWTITAPIELMMGRLGTDAFQRGFLLLALQLVALDVLRRVIWRRGLARYVGAGM